MNKHKVLASKPLTKFLRFTLCKYLKYRFNVKTSSPIPSSITPPYLIIGNHTNFWDPFFIGTYVSEPIHYVTSDEYFRSFILRMLLKKVGAIPKTKFLSDFQTVKDIISVKKNNGIIGIFPEGKRNWDGMTTKSLYSTAKLIKSLKIPVVSVISRGSYLSFPRWAKKSRKGEIDLDFKVIFTPDEISSINIDDIYKKMNSSLQYEEYGYQKEI